MFLVKILSREKGQQSYKMDSKTGTTYAMCSCDFKWNLCMRETCLYYSLKWTKNNMNTFEAWLSHFNFNQSKLWWNIHPPFWNCACFKLLRRIYKIYASIYIRLYSYTYITCIYWKYSIFIYTYLRCLVITYIYMLHLIVMDRFRAYKLEIIFILFVKQKIYVESCHYRLCSL